MCSSEEAVSLSPTHRDHPSLRSLSRSLWISALLWLVSAAPSWSAPTLVSSSPANGATGVARTSPLVFVFSEAMADITPIGSFPPFLIGNFETVPETLTESLGCDWSADQKTLTCTPSDDLPANTTISWRFNPPGTVVPFMSALGANLATVAGTFTTTTSDGGGGGGGGGGGTAPKLVSSTPANGATGVPVGSTVVFVFDQALKPIPQAGGVPPFVKGPVNWTGDGLTASKFSYAWSSDNKSLTCTYSGNLPGNTTLTWTLNAADAAYFLENANDDRVALTTGSFTTGAGSGGGGCDPDGVPDTWGSYTVSKFSEYAQTSAADPMPASESPFAFGVSVFSPAAGPSVTAGSVTLPSGTRKDLTSFGLGGFLSYFEQPATADALDAAYPGGSYTLRFQPTGQAERVVPMNLPAANPPIPKIQNYTQAQSITVTADFTLTWNAFTGATGSDTISLQINEGTNVVFMAPDPCLPRALANTATGIVIPANTLKAGKIYNATLTFNRGFYQSTNTVPSMAGYGAVMRQTTFNLNQGNTPVATAARFVAWNLLPNGHPKLTFQGTAGAAYTIERTPPNFTAPTWAPAGTATPDAAGIGTFEDTAPTAFPLIYRAVAR